MAGVPMWIPHGAVALGFALILIVTVWRLIGLARRSPQTTSEGQTAP
jgi:TRAP-type C4-dicarboxylate transport system permease small subunit